jgi:hypothetical protein
MPVDARHFEIRRDDLRTTRVHETKLDCPAGAVLCRIERFALTANNITYGVFGDAMAYWNFFPAEAGWGRIPVWGHAEVLESKNPDIARSERLYGYLPMATHVVLQPDKVADAQFLDGAAHRRPLPTPYQVYMRLARDPLHEPQHEDHRALLHPLFFTSWLIEDFLADNALFGAQQVVLASASSKTALGVAFLLKQHGVRAVGLTSPGNKPFCEQVGYYDEVLTYDDVAAMGRSHATVFVDMAGDGKLLHAVHHHFGEQLKYSCIVGATHWQQRATQHDLPGAKPQFFFAPTQAVKRQKDWGPAGFFTRFAEAWRAFRPSVEGWLEVRVATGPDAVAATYREVLEGRQPPRLGHLLSLHAG